LPLSDSLAFSTLSLAPAWLENLTQLGYREMTPIQALSLPAMLGGRDVLGQAPRRSPRSSVASRDRCRTRACSR
jgi:ATP-independent RNA helicase DbpA